MISRSISMKLSAAQLDNILRNKWLQDINQLRHRDPLQGPVDCLQRPSAVQHPGIHFRLGCFPTSVSNQRNGQDGNREDIPKLECNIRAHPRPPQRFNPQCSQERCNIAIMRKDMSIEDFFFSCNHGFKRPYQLGNKHPLNHGDILGDILIPAPPVVIHPIPSPKHLIGLFPTYTIAFLLQRTGQFIPITQPPLEIIRKMVPSLQPCLLPFRPKHPRKFPPQPLRNSKMLLPLRPALNSVQNRISRRTLKPAVNRINGLNLLM